jgi:carbamoyltransferase
MSNNIIGLSCFFHDAACCLLKDGVLIAAAEEERFSRNKHDAEIPKGAFNYCLEEGGLTIDEIDCVAYYEEPAKKLARQLWMMLPGLPSEKLARLNPRRPEREIREVLGYDGPIEYVGHHQAHAASTFYFSGFKEAAILTVDGVGEWDTTSFGRGRGDDLELLETVEFPHSLGLLYSTITGYLGFEVNDGEYKVMGLAPYGKPRHVDLIRKLIINQPGGQYLLDLRYFDFTSFKRMYSDEMLSLLGHPPRQPRTEILDFHKDLARSLQYVLEEILMDKLKYLHEVTSMENLCMAGGVALNCVANGRIKREGPFKRMFIQPAAGDSGGALGAAAIAHTRRTNGKTKSLSTLRHAYLGPLNFSVTMKVPNVSANQTISLRLNDSLVAEVAATGRWTTKTCSAPARLVHPGVNQVEIGWPMPVWSVEKQKERVADCLEAGELIEITPMFGLIHSFRVHGSKRMPGTDSLKSKRNNAEGIG